MIIIVTSIHKRRVAADVGWYSSSSGETTIRWCRTLKEINAEVEPQDVVGKCSITPPHTGTVSACIVSNGAICNLGIAIVEAAAFGCSVIVHQAIDDITIARRKATSIERSSVVSDNTVSHCPIATEQPAAIVSGIVSDDTIGYRGKRIVPTDSAALS